MSSYTSTQLNDRRKILQSQTLFFNFLDRYIVNNIAQLFDTSSNAKIIKYLEAERNNMGLSNNDITFKSEIHGENINNSTLHLGIIKDNIELLHLSIHFSVSTLKPSKTGVIHFVKDIYYNQNMSTSERKKIYALISVHHPKGKSNSLEFTIADGYTTPNIKYNQYFNNIKTQEEMDIILQQEMTAIINVLNRIFDEEQPDYYIGNPNIINKQMNKHKNNNILIKPLDIHLKTNNVLQNINKYTKHVTRKNKGFTFLPKVTNDPPIPYIRNRGSIKRSTRKIPRKVNNMK